MLPRISFLIGPQASGKTTLGTALCVRTNHKLLNYNNFIVENKLGDSDDETIISALIQALANEISPNVLIEDFPKTEF